MLILLKTFLYIFYDYFRSQKIQNVSSVDAKYFDIIKKKLNLKKNIKNFLSEKKLSFLEVKISNSKIKELPRPTNLIKIKKLFMK